MRVRVCVRARVPRLRGLTPACAVQVDAALLRVTLFLHPSTDAQLLHQPAVDNFPTLLPFLRRCADAACSRPQPAASAGGGGGETRGEGEPEEEGELPGGVPRAGTFAASAEQALGAAVAVHELLRHRPRGGRRGVVDREEVERRMACVDEVVRRLQEGGAKV